MDYRNEAIASIERAKYELDSKEDHRLRYAALELRMALDALIYAKAKLYEQDLSIEQIDKSWQPKKVLDLLLEIDPHADQGAHLKIGRQEEQGRPAKIMHSYGKERVLSLQEIKKYWPKLGSYLHTPTAHQLANSNGATPNKIRNRCNEVVEILDQVLASPIWNVGSIKSHKFICKNCSKEIIRRMPPIGVSVIAKCINCSATYNLTSVDDKQAKWEPRIEEIECANTSCNNLNKIWEKDTVLGSTWNCECCGINNEIVLAIICNEE